MINFNLKRWLKFFWIILLIPISQKTLANSGDLPFATTLQTLQQAISGPFLMSASIIMIVITCLLLAFGEWGDGFKKIITIVLWLSIAFGAVTFVTTMFHA